MMEYEALQHIRNVLTEARDGEPGAKFYLRGIDEALGIITATIGEPGAGGNAGPSSGPAVVDALNDPNNPVWASPKARVETPKAALAPDEVAAIAQAKIEEARDLISAEINGKIDEALARPGCFADARWIHDEGGSVCWNRVTGWKPDHVKRAWQFRSYQISEHRDGKWWATCSGFSIVRGWFESWEKACECCLEHYRENGGADQVPEPVFDWAEAILASDPPVKEWKSGPYSIRTGPVQPGDTFTAFCNGEVISAGAHLLSFEDAEAYVRTYIKENAAKAQAEGRHDGGGA